MRIKLSTLAYLAFTFLALVLAHISSAYIKNRFLTKKKQPIIIVPHTISVEPILDNNPDKTIIYYDLEKILKQHYGNDSLAYFDLLKAYLKKNDIFFIETIVNNKGDTITKVENTKIKIERNKKTGQYRVDIGNGWTTPEEVRKHKKTGELGFVVDGEFYPSGIVLPPVSRAW